MSTREAGIPPTNAALTVSLEDHLADALRPLLTLLPHSIAAQLTGVLDAQPPQLARSPLDSNVPDEIPQPVRTIPYDLLSAISKWSRTPEGAQALARHEPPLRPQDYAMVALLAGTRTCPDRRYPNLPAPGSSDDSSETARRRELGDRRAVTAVVNALLSIGGSGVAIYWAAGRLAWKEEWRVLLALSVAIVVAASEAILYLIWDSRRSKSRRRPALRFRAGQVAPHSPSALEKKFEGESSPDGGASAHDKEVIAATATDRPGTDGQRLRGRVRGNTTRT
ncbi:hypothetical protein GY45DRAFT_1294726 [Cubamyces sp. BRFM 1775]|nr:hypothetical protein GY45DRAFT_1294726 [Cubamyces sp. BRFM 1775]